MRERILVGAGAGLIALAIGLFVHVRLSMIALEPYGPALWTGTWISVEARPRDEAKRLAADRFEREQESQREKSRSAPSPTNDAEESDESAAREPVAPDEEGSSKGEPAVPFTTGRRQRLLEAIRHVGPRERERRIDRYTHEYRYKSAYVQPRGRISLIACGTLALGTAMLGSGIVRHRKPAPAR